MIMAMVPLLLLTCFSFNILHSSASQFSYKDHCASVVPESNSHNYTFKLFPLGEQVYMSYYTGGDRILGPNPQWQQNSFLLRTRKLRETDVAGLFKVEGFISIRIFITINLDGFWSESTGKLCIVGSGTAYSRGKTRQLDAVFKLNNVFNSSNISSLISGSLESLSSENEESYFEPFSVLVLPIFNYKFTLDSKEAKDEIFSVGRDDAEKGLPGNIFKFHSFFVSREIRKLHLEYPIDCNSPQNCIPFGGISGYFPPLLSLNVIECSYSKKNHMRFLIKFDNQSYEDFNTQAFNPKMALVGEGWWDERKNHLYIVACHFLGLGFSSFASAHMGDCSVRLSLTSPSIWSVKDTSSFVGKIWSNKTVKDPGYNKGITFKTEDDRKVGVEGLKYEYTQLDRVKNLCRTVMNKGKRYPNPYSYNMKFDMSVRDSITKVAWGYSAPLSVNDQFYNLRFTTISFASSPKSSRAVPAEKFISSGLFNISYTISISLLPTSTLCDSQSLFSMSFEAVKISAEGVYDAGTGSLCMVGCRNLPSQNNGIPTVHSVDCEILVKFQFPPLHASHEGYIDGTIESMREKSDSLYFKRLYLTSVAYYKEVAKETIQRKDIQIFLVLISNTLACVSVVFQLYHVKKNPKALPFISLIMLSFLTLNHMIPLIPKFEALFIETRNTKYVVLLDVARLESNELVVWLVTMVAFLMQFCLLQLTWSARNNTHRIPKSLWVSEKKAVNFTLPLCVAGFLIAIMAKMKKINNGDRITMSSGYQQALFWEVLKSYGGFMLDSFLLPQILMNLFSNMRENALSFPFYFGTSLVRLLPHAYNLYRTSNYVRQNNESYLCADPSADFSWDIAILCVGLLFAVIIFFQQRFGGYCILPYRFEVSEAYEKVPALAEEEEEEDNKTPKI